MNRTKKTLLNTVFSLASLLVLSILTMVFTRQVLVVLGSDYNGLNATAAQITSALMLIEGGFSLASLVALYKPYVDNDHEKVNRLINHSAAVFKKLAMIMLGVGIPISIVYSLIVKTNVQFYEVLGIFLITVLIVSYRVSYTNSYRLIFQASQTEYIVYGSHLVTNVITYILMIYFLRAEKSIILVKLLHLLGTVLDGLVIEAFRRKRFPYIIKLEKRLNEKIPGSRDVFWAKITSFIYTSSPVFFLSIFVGTVQTSVYAVYNSVVTLIANVLNAFLVAPQGALGQIISERDDERLVRTYMEYEKVSILIICTAIATMYPMFLPFVRLFTRGVHDIEYLYQSYAILLSLISLTQFIHIPSGQCINLAGHFNIVKKIQVYTCFLLVVSSIVGAYLFGSVGILSALLVSNLALAFMEMRYVRRSILKISAWARARWIIIIVSWSILISVSEFALLSRMAINSWIHFVGIGVLLVALNAILIFIMCIVIDRSFVEVIKARIQAVIRRSN